MFDIKSILTEQKVFFAKGGTIPIDFRIKQLEKLHSLLTTHEEAIARALQKDLHKAPMEAIFNEILLVKHEIKYVIKNLHKWASPRKVPSPFPLFWPGKSEIHYEPYGSVLIVGPWNYPFLLVLSPLIGAISAGNCVIVKPSEIAQHTQDLLINLISENFPREYIAAVKANPEEMNILLEENFDYIFYTGGSFVGKIIMQAAAKHLTPVTLELGGKSPCIVEESANLDFAARRIIWAKMLNSGQTCIAPDFLCVQASSKKSLIDKMKTVITEFYGTDPYKSPDFGRIINKKHFLRLIQLMQQGNMICGGNTNEEELYIAPTLIDNITWDDPIMQEEIFGPLLPILTYDKVDDLIQILKNQQKPLALYLFSKDKKHQENVLKQISFGGGCINDCILQEVNLNLPFGGVHGSGMGNYHGKYSFETFSHSKSIYRKTLPLETKLEYPPYSNRKLWWLRRLIKT